MTKCELDAFLFGFVLSLIVVTISMAMLRIIGVADGDVTIAMVMIGEALVATALVRRIRQKAQP